MIDDLGSTVHVTVLREASWLLAHSPQAIYWNWAERLMSLQSALLRVTDTVSLTLSGSSLPNVSTFRFRIIRLLTGSIERLMTGR